MNHSKNQTTEKLFYTWFRKFLFKYKMTLKTISNILVYLLLNMGLIYLALFLSTLILPRVGGDLFYIITTFLSTFNLIVLLYRLKRNNNYSQSYIKSALIGFPFLLIAFFEMEIVMEFYFKIDLEWSIRVENVLVVLVIPCLVSIFFRSENKTNLPDEPLDS